MFKVNTNVNENNICDYVTCPHCGDIVDIYLSDIFQTLKLLKRGSIKMDFDKLLEVIKASQIGTLETQKIMLQQLAENTDTNYASALAEIDNQITKINNL